MDPIRINVALANFRGKIEPRTRPQAAIKLENLERTRETPCLPAEGQEGGRRATVPVNKLLRFAGFHGGFESTKYNRSFRRNACCQPTIEPVRVDSLNFPRNGYLWREKVAGVGCYLSICSRNEKFCRG